MATKKVGISVATFLVIIGLVWSAFQFWDRKVEAGIPTRVTHLEEGHRKLVSDSQVRENRIDALEKSQSSTDTRFFFIMKQLDEQGRKLDKVGEAVGVRKE